MHLRMTGNIQNIICPRKDAEQVAADCAGCDLARAFELLHQTYNHRRYVSPDPLQFLYDYSDIRDREIVGIVASGLAYGRVGQILKSVKAVLDLMGKRPRAFIMRTPPKRLREIFADFRHRYNSGDDVALTLYGVRTVIERYGSLEACFGACVNQGDKTVAEPLTRFVAEILADVEEDGRFIVPVPWGNSCRKRMNLFLRWMVRCDDVDPGGWKDVDPSMLIIPLDTHMFNLSRAFHFTSRKTADIRAALEITESFRTICSDDPVKYDFALTRLGIRDEIDLTSHLVRIRGN